MGGDGEVGISDDGVKLGDLLFDLRLLSSGGVSSHSKISFSEILGLLLPVIRKKRIEIFAPESPS